MTDRTALRPNSKLADARRRLLSPSGSGRVMSRQEVADAANDYLWSTYRERASMDRNYLGKLEQGRHRWPRERHREALRHVLRAASDADLGFFIVRGRATRGASAVGADAGTRSGGLGNEEELEVNRRELLSGVAAPGMAALVAAVAGPFAGEIRVERFAPDNDLERLTKRLGRIRRAYQHSRYEYAAKELPSLLTVLRRQRRDGSSSDLARLDAEAHQVASAVLLKSEQPVLAAIAAERSMTAARETADELTRASSLRAVVHCLMASGYPEPAAVLATDAADQLARSVNLDEASAVSVYGALLLRGAIAAAQMENHDQAQTLLDEASRAARHLGTDGNLYWTAFGPTNVVAHRVAVAVELGDAGTAIRLASTIDITKLDLPERKAMLLLDTARAFTQWGKWERALETIRRAERHAPEEVSRRPAARIMIQELASRAPFPLRHHVHDYARTVGVPV